MQDSIRKLENKREPWKRAFLHALQEGEQSMTVFRTPIPCHLNPTSTRMLLPMPTLWSSTAQTRRPRTGLSFHLLLHSPTPKLRSLTLRKTTASKHFLTRGVLNNLPSRPTVSFATDDSLKIDDLECVLATARISMPSVMVT